MPIEIHFHCAYVGNGKFRVTATPVKQPENLGVIELTEIELARFIKAIRPGQKHLEVGELKILGDAVWVLRAKEYLELVISSYQQAIDRGFDHDARLKKLRERVDPTEGSGGCQHGGQNDDR